jgi:hypothetical protein
LSSTRRIEAATLSSSWVMCDLMPDAAAIAGTYRKVVERARAGGDHAPTEDALRVFTGRMRHYSDRLTVHVMVTGRQDWSVEQLRKLAENAIVLGGEIVRGLNDCLDAGALHGYASVTEDRVEVMVKKESGPIHDPGNETVFSGIKAEIDGWLGALGPHAAVARHGGSAADVTVREAFATLGAATAMATFLRQRTNKAQRGDRGGRVSDRRSAASRDVRLAAIKW